MRHENIKFQNVYVFILVYSVYIGISSAFLKHFCADWDSAIKLNLSLFSRVLLGGNFGGSI